MDFLNMNYWRILIYMHTASTREHTLLYTHIGILFPNFEIINHLKSFCPIEILGV